MNDTVIKIQAYNEFEAGMTALKDEGNFLPDATTDEGYKASKEFAKKARKVEINIEKTRVDEKKYFVAGGKQVDIQAKTLTAEISNVRLPHFEACKAVDDAEKLKKQKRQDEATAKIETIAIMIETAEHLDSVGVSELMEQCEQFDTESGLWELTNDAIACKLRVSKKLLDMYLTKQQNEANEKELAELRAKQAIQDQKDHDARIAKQASEQAEKDKQQAVDDKEKADQAKIEADNRLIEQKKKSKIDAENALVESKRLADEASENARLLEVKRQDDEREADRVQSEKLESNKKHVGVICKATKESLMQECELDEATAKKVTKAIAKRLIANLSIQY